MILHVCTLDVWNGVVLLTLYYWYSSMMLLWVNVKWPHVWASPHRWMYTHYSLSLYINISIRLLLYKVITWSSELSSWLFNSAWNISLKTVPIINQPVQGGWPKCGGHSIFRTPILPISCFFFYYFFLNFIINNKGVPQFLCQCPHQFVHPCRLVNYEVSLTKTQSILMCWIRYKSVTSTFNVNTLKISI